MNASFSVQTLSFLKKAGRQKSTLWLDKNRDEYTKLVLLPLQNLARQLKEEVGPLAPTYHFPQKGIGRIKRPANRVRENGGTLYKCWLSYSAARPRESRFSHNPNLFFLIDSSDPKEGVLVAGGLYMPSSQQLKAIREAIAHDASEFEKLFRTKEFSSCFKGGFSDEKKATRPPRGFDPNHPKIDWLKLQAYFVWRPYSKKEFTSRKFPEIVAKDWKQILRLNALLEKALRPSVRRTTELKRRPARDLAERIDDATIVQRPMDF